MTSNQRRHYRQRRRRRPLWLILLCAILRGPSRSNAFAVRTNPRTIRRRLSTSTCSFVPTRHGHDNGLEPSRRDDPRLHTQQHVILQMATSNDNTTYLNNTDTSASNSQMALRQKPRHEGGTTVDADLGQLQSRIDAMKAEIMWETQTRGPLNPELGPIGFVQAVLNALGHPDDPLPDSGFRTLIRSSSKKWREQTRQSVGAPPEASEDAIARTLSRAMSRPGCPYALMVDAVGVGVCSVAGPFAVLDFEDGTAWVTCVFTRCEGMNKMSMIVTKWSLVQRESDNSWLIDDILFNDLSKQEI